jgi:hypothetical protein
MIPLIEQIAARQVANGAKEVEALAIEGAIGGNKNTIDTRRIDDLYYRVQATGIVPTVQEFGSVEHIIAPKDYPEGFLSWVDKSGVRRFAKFVIHPGTQPRPFMRPAADSYLPVFQKEFAAAIGEGLRKA